MGDDKQEYMELLFEAVETKDWSRADAWIEQRFPGAALYFQLTRGVYGHGQKASEIFADALEELVNERASEIFADALGELVNEGAGMLYRGVP